MNGRGRGFSRAHHGELLQGVFRCRHAGCDCPGLLTAPLHAVACTATFRADRSGRVRVIREPTDAVEAFAVPRGATEKARLAALLTLRHLGAREGIAWSGGDLRLRSDLPVGAGMGSSTADAVAAARAVADAVGESLSDRELARLTVRAEGAADPLWTRRPVLYAHRHGHVIEHLGDTLPALWLIRCVTGGGRPVDTLAMPVSAAAPVDEYERLRARLRTAVGRGDSHTVAQVATRSAELNQSRHHKPELDVLLDVADRCGASGVQVAHSGNVAGILLADAPTPDVTAEIAARLAGHGIPVVGVATRIGGARAHP